MTVRQVNRPLALINGRIRTGDAGNSVAEAILIDGDRIAAIGSRATVELHGGNEAEVVDLRGRTVLPGLIDAHTHLEGTALHLTYYADCHAPPHTDLAGVLGALHDHAKAHPDAEWVIGQGSFMLAEKLRERRYPTLAEMDEAVPGRPALLRAGAHISVVNSAALRLLGIDAHFTPPLGAHIQRDANGNPTGVLIEMAWNLPLPRFTLEQTAEAVAQTAALLSSYGVTTIHDQFPSATGLRAYQYLRREGRLPLRITFTVLCADLTAVKTFLRYGLESGFGDDELRFGAIKFFVDGGITGAAGAFYDEYAHQPGNRGHLKLAPDEIREMVRLIDGAGVQISAHVVGDRALDLLLDAFAALPNPSGKRHRLEHAGHLCMTPARIQRIKDLGFIPIMTMPFLSSFGDFLPEYLGERARGAFALRRLLDAGLTVPGSSDCLGAQPESLSPWFGMWCAVERTTYQGRLLAPEEAVTIEEALRTYTTHAAFADYAEKRIGSLEPGKYADLIVCDHDPFAIPPALLPVFRPVATLRGGKVVHGAL